MTTIDLSSQLLSPEGDVLGTATLGRVLSDQIMSIAITDDPMKWFNYALTLRKTGIITVEDTDKDVLINQIILPNPSLSIIAKGNLVNAINANAGLTTPSPSAPDTTVEAVPSPEPVVDSVPVDPVAPSDPSVQQISDISSQSV